MGSELHLETCGADSGELKPLGDPTTHRVDVRVIAASNRDLEDSVSIKKRYRALKIPLKSQKPRPRAREQQGPEEL